jgi:hypothetical protein
VIVDIDIKELGVTLLIGGYLLYGTDLILRHLGKVDVRRRRRARNDKPETRDTKAIAVGVALSFSLGILAEASTDWLANDTTNEFDNRLTQQVVENWKLTPLGKDLARNRVFSRANGDGIADAERAWAMSDTAAVTDTAVLSDAIKPTYYLAKNFIAGHPQYQHELLGLESRMNFAGSFAVCSIVLLLVAVGTSGFAGWKHGRETGASESSPATPAAHAAPAVPITPEAPVPRASPFEDLNRNLSIALTALVFLGTTSYFAYHSQVGEYTRRALGYYASILQERELERKASGGGSPIVQDLACPPDKACVVILPRDK